MKVEYNRDGYLELPRGGYLIDTSIGYIQIGSPPETVKDTMLYEKKTPLVFILPNKFFHIDKGISTAELEFPLYYNFYLRQQRTTIICTEKQEEQLKVVLQESVFGPANINLSSEYIDGEETYGFPDMRAEIDHFGSNKKLEDLVKFVNFVDHQVVLDTVTIIKNENGDFTFKDGDKKTNIPGEVGFRIKYDVGQRLAEPYNPPLLGITCLGPSHGFDPNDNTSGFIIWLNHKGIMVDPPVNSTEWLRESNVNPKLINHVILTHCHADHDAGTFQKILEESKVTIHSTPTVMESFLRKYCALTEIPRKEIITLFDFQPAIIGKPSYINGAQFHFFYSLHSIPALGFEFFFQDKSFIYSSDHKNDIDTFNDLYQKKILTPTRYEFLKNFPWDRDIIYHEAGVPPLHTKISHLASLPEEIQKKITVYHISKKDMLQDSHLTLAKFGMENTLYPKITPPKYTEAYNLLNVLSQIDIFSGYTIEKAKEFLMIVNEERYKRGERIIQKGTEGDKFYIIASGNVKFENFNYSVAGAASPVKRFGTYEYFGEASLLQNITRQSDAYADTDVVALTIEKSKFLQFIRGSDLLKNLNKLNNIRDTNSWEVFSTSPNFKTLTSYQLTQLELCLNLETFQPHDVLITEGKLFDFIYIIRSGQAQVSKKGVVKADLSTGDIIGEVYNISNNIVSNYTFVANTKLDVYSIPKTDLINYIKKNPGVYMRLSAIYS
jgi:CRP-like cAMP-binding protein